MISHGYCLLWNSKLIWGLVTSNLLIAFSYFSIPLILYTVAVITNLKIPTTFRNVLILFSLFIFFCGAGHLIDIICIWYPWYWLKVLWDFCTGVISLMTALYLKPLACRFVKHVQMADKKA